MTTPSSATIRAAAADPVAFATYVLARPMRPYQAEIARQVLRSVRDQLGLTITVMMARQMGKNEVSAQIEAYLLNLYQRRGGTVVKAAPTLRPQLGNSPANRGRAFVEQDAIVLGKARCQLLSAAPTSNVVGPPPICCWSWTRHRT
jgi:hypothetical protein